MNWLNNLFKPRTKFVFSKAFVHKIPNYGIISIEGINLAEVHELKEQLDKMLVDSGKKVVIVNKKLQVFDFKKSKKKEL